ncbi:hypothetical protein P2318_17170 [Myxococcaceae bacterium GXIMD 01537]
MRAWKRWLAVLALAGCGGEAWEQREAREEVEATAATNAASPERGGSSHGPEFRWVRHLSGPAFDIGVSVAMDREGNALSASSVESGVDFGSGMMGRDVPSLGLAKYSPEGRLLWARLFECWGANGVAADRQGNVVLVFAKTFGGGACPAAEKPGTYLARFDPKGRPLGTRLLIARPSEESSWDIHDVKVDTQGHLLLAGEFRGTVDFGDGPVTSPGDGSGGFFPSAFLLRFTPSGHFEWAHTWERRVSAGAGVAEGEEGELYFAGTLRPPSPDGTASFLQRLSPDGRPRWTRYLEGTSASGVANHGNRVVLAGTFTGSFTFAGQEHVSEDHPEEYLRSDGFLAAWTREGEERWARDFGVNAVAVAMDSRDGVVVTGRYEAGDDFGQGPVSGTTDHPFSVINGNVYVARYERIHGELQWVHPIVSEGATSADIAVTKLGESVTIGSFVSPTDFGKVTLTPTDFDIFLLKLGP